MTGNEYQKLAMRTNDGKAKKTYEYDGTTYYPIPEFKDYFASKDGKIISTKKNIPLILKQSTGKYGHKYVFIINDYKKGKRVPVHRLVLSAICGENKKDLLCRHLDDNPTNNNVENLAWGTKQDNANDRKKNKGYSFCGANAPKAKLTDKEVMIIRYRYANGESSRDLGNEYGIAHNNILAIIHGKSWPHLPVVPVKVKHISKSKTPRSKESIRKSTEALNRYALSIKKSRELIPCACGCGTMIPMHDNNGKRRYYVQGHNARRKHWT